MLGRMRRGQIAGAVATAIMTGVFSAGQLGSLIKTPPPEETAEKIPVRAGDWKGPVTAAFRRSWLATHMGYGSAIGGVYALARPVLPRSPITAGLIFGGVVWATNYIGILPALRLYPSPMADSKPRMWTTIAAHAVYGVTLAATEQRLSHR